MSEQQPSVALITALSSIWAAIQARHPDVPDVVLIPAPAPRGQSNVLGHFAPVRWRTREEGGGFMHEVVVVAEHLRRGAVDVAETLLHEAAHAMNCNRGIRDCTASQYHNRKFAQAAIELGLEVAQVKHYGFAYTTLPESTREVYAVQIAKLEDALVFRRSAFAKSSGPTVGPTSTPGARPTRPSRNLKATCRCGFIIRVSRRTMDSTIIACGTCISRFEFS